MPHSFLTVIQSDYLIRIVDINSYTKWQTVQIQTSWLLQKPTDLDLHCLQRQGISVFSRTRCMYLHHSTGCQGPVVQSVVNLTSSLRDISLTVLTDLIHNILIFFAEKMRVAFALQKLLTFFQQKISAYLRITRCKF